MTTSLLPECGNLDQCYSIFDFTAESFEFGSASDCTLYPSLGCSGTGDEFTTNQDALAAVPLSFRCNTPVTPLVIQTCPTPTIAIFWSGTGVKRTEYQACGTLDTCHDAPADFLYQTDSNILGTSKLCILYNRPEFSTADGVARSFTANSNYVDLGSLPGGSDKQMVSYECTATHPRR